MSVIVSSDLIRAEKQIIDLLTVQERLIEDNVRLRLLVLALGGHP